MSRIRVVSTMGALFAAVVVVPASAIADGAVSGGATAVATAVAPAATAPKAFLKIDAAGGTLPGDSADPAHPGWIEASSLELLGPSAPAAPGAGATGGAGVGKVAHGDIKITKSIDKASPMLRAAVSSGVHLPNVVIEMLKPAPDGSGQVYLRITLREAFVSGISFSQGAPGGVPKETISFKYGALEVQYTRQKPDGSPGPYGPLKRDWDLRAAVRL